MTDQPAPEADPPAPTPPAEDPKPTETVEFWKQKAREQEKRAKDNADAAKRLKEIEDANKSDAEKAAARITELENTVQASQRDALRFKVAAKHQIGDEDAELFLTGSDEETLTRQAERLAGKSDKKNGNYAPREGRNPPKPTDNADEREFTRNLFGGGS